MEGQIGTEVLADEEEKARTRGEPSRDKLPWGLLLLGCRGLTLPWKVQSWVKEPWKPDLSVLVCVYTKVLDVLGKVHPEVHDVLGVAL